MSAEVIDYATGEVISAELVPFSAPTAVERSAEGVVAFLSHARQWLASAVAATGPAEVVEIKAAVAMAATYSRELTLSKEIQMDAQEMVRRAEYALGKAIREGQTAGTIRSAGQAVIGRDQAGVPRGDRADLVRINEVPHLSPKDYIPHTQEAHEIYTMADADPEVVENAIAEARAEGNPTRANVVRKIKVRQSPVTRDDRAKEIARLAELGHSTRQIAPLIGIGEEAVTKIQRDYHIDIPADRYVKRSRRIDTNRIIENTVSALEGLAIGLELINPDDIDQDRAQTWTDSLAQSMKTLSKAYRQIKESVQ